MRFKWQISKKLLHICFLNIYLQIQKCLKAFLKGWYIVTLKSAHNHDFYGTDFWPFYSQIFLAFLTNKQKIYYSLMGFDTIEINLDW